MVVAGVGGPARTSLSMYLGHLRLGGRAILGTSSASETFALFLPNLEPF
jgi:hypothetical protein